MFWGLILAGAVAVLPVQGGLNETLKSMPATTFTPNIVLSDCTGSTGKSHWGYVVTDTPNGSHTEAGGVVVHNITDICINPHQVDPYSSLRHEYGHFYWYTTGKEAWAAAMFGGYETSAECFAKIHGATTFGEGGCPSSTEASMRKEMGW